MARNEKDGGMKGKQFCRFVNTPDGCIKENCPFSHDNKGKPCNFLRQGKECPFGKQCLYLHVSSTESTLKSSWTNVRPPKHKNPHKNELRNWLFYTTDGSNPDKPLSKAVRYRFFQDAHSLVLGDVGNMQAVIQGLASYTGLKRVMQVVNQDFEALSTDAKMDVFKSALLPLFQVIGTHDVLASALCGAWIGTIYSVIYGNGGQYALALYRYLVSIADALSVENLEIVLTVFATIVDMNGTAPLVEGFKQIYNGLEATVANIEKQHAQVHIATTKIRYWLERVNRRLGVEDTVRATQPNAALSKPRPQFKFKVDPPGRLSDAGPRHDNDAADIREIQILPTYEEIVFNPGNRLPYLPVLDPAQLHLEGIPALADRHFRLYREDSLGQIRTAIQLILKRTCNATCNTTSSSRQLDHGTRTNAYRHVAFENLYCDAMQGMVVIVSLQQPEELRNTGTGFRRQWWETRQRLQKDTLVCLLDPVGKRVIFGIIAEVKKREHRKSPYEVYNDAYQSSDKEEDNITFRDVITHADRAVVSFIPAEKESIATIVECSMGGHPISEFTLLEFPKVLLQAFKPTLGALQSMITTQDIPFKDILAPSSSTSGLVDIEPPDYARRHNFRFDLSCLCSEGHTLFLSVEEHFNVNALVEYSSLDLKQAEALVHALSSRLALCQGPPGTGKSFVGVALTRVLLANKDDAKLGPILVVCYTNHALDQILEHYLESGIRDVIRIGSRSKSELLQDLNLRHVSKNVWKTEVESKERKNRFNTVVGSSNHVNTTIRELKQTKSADPFKSYLQRNHPVHHDQFWGLDEDGFEMYAPNVEYIIRLWLQGNNAPVESLTELRARTVEQLLNDETSVWAMTLAEREALHAFWVQDWKDSCTQRLLTAFEDHQMDKKSFEAANKEIDLRCLQQSDIIGITTSGLARNLDLLKRLRIKVVIVEEAGEVLEAHTLTALLPSVEHAILIGDHFQLKPSVANFSLSSESQTGLKHSLDMSLFERLVAPPKDLGSTRLPLTTLNTQRRMHPSISALIRPLYPGLQDAPSVFSYPRVPGMNKNLFWLDHDSLEVGTETDELVATSKSNDFEVAMSACIVAHLLSQGVYHSQDIAVITPYLGQLFKLRNRLSEQYEIVLNDRDADEMDKHVNAEVLQPTKPQKATTLLQSLKIATVDNFQGEEAKVVIISLVRSNKDAKCGFLKTNNRINVLLSRAKHGMYIIGNSATSSGVPMWSQVIDILKADGNIGKKLALRCERHPKSPIEVSIPDDFQRFSPEGGCDLRCDRRLKCGHACLLKCHSNIRHDNVKCLEPCPRPRDGCDHFCQKSCGEQCDPKCEEVLHDVNVELQCGHVVQDLRCWEYQAQDKILCKVMVKRNIAGCGHNVDAKCSIDVQAKDFFCNALCDGQLTCGHNCKMRCSLCRQRNGNRHGPCQETCGRNYTNCSHSCTAKCHDGRDCNECRKRCDVVCGHSRCNLACNEPCIPCAQLHCVSACQHSSCSLPCAAPCDWIPCSKRCSRALSCGHQCPSLCGEICPAVELCQECASEDVKNMVADYLLFSRYREIDLDSDPILVPPCGHPLTMTSMDGLLGMSEVYDMKEDGTIQRIKECGPFSQDRGRDGQLKKLPLCPSCRGSLRSINRYGRIVRRAFLDDSTKRFMTSSATNFGHLVDRFYAALEALTSDHIMPRRILPAIALNLTGTRETQFQTVCQVTDRWDRYEEMTSVREAVAQHAAKVHRDQTPFSKLWSLIESARRRSGRTAPGDLHKSVSLISFHLMATALLIRCDVVLLAAVLTDFEKLRSGPLGLQFQVDFSESREDCATLIQEALEAKDYERVVEGHIFWARYAAMQLGFANEPARTILKADGKAHLDKAHELCTTKRGKLDSLIKELEEVHLALNGGTFMQTVSSEERRQVLAAMAKEFRGTGHWYTCENGHPFTVGECGMPMELARCPQCAAPIGGQDHRPVEGVTRADALERQLRDMTLGRD